MSTNSDPVADAGGQSKAHASAQRRLTEFKGLFTVDEWDNAEPTLSIRMRDAKPGETHPQCHASIPFPPEWPTPAQMAKWLRVVAGVCDRFDQDVYEPTEAEMKDILSLTPTERDFAGAAAAQKRLTEEGA